MHVIMENVSCVVSPSELQPAIDAGYKHIYMLTSKGVIKHHRLRGENRYLQLKVDSIPGYTEDASATKEEIRFLPDGKIPYVLWEQIVSFFKKVIEVKKEEVEAMIWVLWNPTQGYFLHVPDQKISKASVSYEWESVPEGSSIICDIHSH